ncbi:MAG: hypothetical protein O7A69_03440 [SAR324 cluster bacterium]|nr:hypothetical protein [SAR324 cluster bacterium]
MLVLKVDRIDHKGAELLPVRGIKWRKGSRYQRGIEADFHPHGLGRPAFNLPILSDSTHKLRIGFALSTQYEGLAADAQAAIGTQTPAVRGGLPPSTPAIGYLIM